VKTQFGWYVFEVQKITPASQQSLDQSRDAIKSLLEGQRKQKALDAFIKDFRDQYRDKTHCADDYRVAECANAPKDETTDTGPSQSAQPEPQTPTTTAPSTTTP
jgi:foldase protein PrsA